MAFQRIIVIVLDGLGVGALPDADRFGDRGAHTLRTVLEIASPDLPHLERLGLCRAAGLPTETTPRGAFGRMAEQSLGKDTITGHFELCGLVTETPLPVYPGGFPPEILTPFSRVTGRGILGNRAASGTEIISELGSRHRETGDWIVYTSQDSVFQVAAHEDVVPLEELYAACRTARDLLRPPHGVGRVIARPFTGSEGSFQRTARRRDFGFPPPGPTLLDRLSEAGLDVVGIGKIRDIFTSRGLTASEKTAGNTEGIQAILAWLKKGFHGLLFANLIDFDMRFGHRNDAVGFGRALEEFDAALPRLLDALGSDLLMITADHGCDPGHPGTDHTREYVPVLCWHGGQTPKDLGVRDSFADLGRTVAENYGLSLDRGRSYLEALTGGHEPWRE